MASTFYDDVWLADKVKANPKAYDFSDIPIAPTHEQMDDAASTLASALGTYQKIKGNFYAKSPMIEEELAFFDYQEDMQKTAANATARENLLKMTELAQRLFYVKAGEDYRPITQGELRANFKSTELAEAIATYVGYSFGGSDPN